MNLTRRRAAGAALCLAASLLPACALEIPGTSEPPQLYTLTPKSTFAPDLPQAEWQLIVETPIAAAGLNSARIALQRSPVTLDYFARAAWTDRAPQMIQTLLIESFENTGKIVAVGRESVGLRPDYTLKTELREFQAEYQGEGPPQVRVRINAKLVRAADRAIVAGDTFENLIRSESTDLHAIVLAFDESLGKTLRRVVEWTLRAAGPLRRAPAAAS